MPRKLIYTPQAVTDIADQLAYIADDNPDRAERFARRLEAYLDDTANSPFDTSKAHPVWPTRYRYLVFGSKPHARTIIVTVTPDEIVVHRIIGRQSYSPTEDDKYP